VAAFPASAEPLTFPRPTRAGVPLRELSDTIRGPWVHPAEAARPKIPQPQRPLVLNLLADWSARPLLARGRAPLRSPVRSGHWKHWEMPAETPPPAMGTERQIRPASNLWRKHRRLQHSPRWPPTPAASATGPAPSSAYL